MLHYTVAWLMWAHGTPARKQFRKIARHSGEQGSIGFQPVSGFGADTGRNPNGPFRARPTPKTFQINTPLQNLCLWGGASPYQELP